jgi:hypothetical protein
MCNSIEELLELETRNPFTSCRPKGECFCEDDWIDWIEPMINDTYDDLYRELKYRFDNDLTYKLRENKYYKYQEYLGDIYGCCGGDCERCYECNPIYYFGVKRKPTIPAKVRETMLYLTTCKNPKNMNSYINAREMGFIDADLNLLFNL